MASPANQRGQAIIELLITVSVLISFFYLAYEVSGIALTEQRQYQFHDSKQFMRR